MYWSYESKKLDAAVKHMSWCPPWVGPDHSEDEKEQGRNVKEKSVDVKIEEGENPDRRAKHGGSAGVADVEQEFVSILDVEGRGEAGQALQASALVKQESSVGCEKKKVNEGQKYLGEHKDLKIVPDAVGLGRAATMWWTQNCKYNAVQDVHRLNVEADNALEALDVGVDSYRGVRQAFARDCPDLVTQQIVLRTELNMQVVMPSVIKHSKRWPFKSMARFETGTLGGNLHAHGFSYGGKPPNMPRRVKAQAVEDGDETSDLGSENDDMNDGGGEGAGSGAARAEDAAVSLVVNAETSHANSDGDYSPSSGDDEMRESFCDGELDFDKLVRNVIKTKCLGQDIPMEDVISDVLGGGPGEAAVAGVRSALAVMVDEGLLERLSSETGECFQKVPPVPEHFKIGRRLGLKAQSGRAGVRFGRVDGGYVEEEPKRDGVGKKEELEKKFSEFFEKLVSTWNPCYSQDGVCRFDWDAELDAHDIEYKGNSAAGMPSEHDVPHRWPERVRLSDLLR
jgi:hypothetical protein